MSVELFPWNTMTWRTRVEDLERKTADLQKEHQTVQSQLMSARHDLALAENMGFAEDKLPGNYGKLVVERHPESAEATIVKLAEETAAKDEKKKDSEPKSTE